MLRLVRFIAGAAVATLIWWYATPAYDGLLARFVQPAHAEKRVITVTRIDAPSIQIPADQLTYNVILLAGLLCAAPPRRVWPAAVAILVLLAFHVVALHDSIEATYATRAGAYSDAHYSPLAQNFWNAADFIYRIGGMFAIAFVCWYTVSHAQTRSGPDRAGRSVRKRTKS